MATPEKYIAPVDQGVSPKQMEILSIVGRGNPDGSFVDIRQIMSRVSYGANLEAIKFIMRYMIAQKRIECAGKERRAIKWGDNGRLSLRSINVYRLTDTGRALLHGDYSNLE